MHRILKGVIAISICLIFSSIAWTQENRSYDGTNNNMQNPTWGASHTALSRLVNQVSYQDGVGAINNGLPNPRSISNDVFAQFNTIEDESRSDFVWAFGQFLSHDISLVENGADPAFIEIPFGDGTFTAGDLMPVSRNAFIPGTGESADNPREYANVISSFIDASNVYGSDLETANWLRAKDENGNIDETGKLKVSTGTNGDLLPWNTIDGEYNSDIDPTAPAMDNNNGALSQYYVAGDIRANENLLLISMHTLFLREHNRLCDELILEHPNWSGEQIYQRARKLVGAFIQKITFDDWLNSMGVEVSSYDGYEPTQDPTVSNTFSAAAFRLGHTLLSSEIKRLNNDGDYIDRGNIPLDSAFFNPIEIIYAGGIDSYFKGMAVQYQQKMDCKVINDVRNFLFGEPGEGGLDLAAINILRGRDRGLPSFTQLQEYLGQPVFQNFLQLTQNQTEADDLALVYDDVSEVDAWVGLLGEKHENGAMLGKLLMYIISEQFEHLRDGDRFWYEEDPALNVHLDEIKNTNLHDIIMRNTKISIMQDDVFIAKPHEDIALGPETLPIHLNAILYPNPVTSDDDSFTIKLFSDYDGELTIRFINSLGNQMDGYTYNIIEGDNFISMDLDHEVPRGFYSVLLESRQYKNTLKLIKH